MRRTPCLLALFALAVSAADADAGGPFRRRSPVVTPGEQVVRTTTITPIRSSRKAIASVSPQVNQAVRPTGLVATDAPVRASVDNRVAASPMLGSFQPGSYITVRSNGFQGGGYSPIGFYGGNNSMDVYGPISALRAISAPVNVVTRGYDGGPVVVEGTSFSTPFLPEASPVRYPTRASNYSAIRDPAAAPRSGNGIMWVDQN